MSHLRNVYSHSAVKAFGRAYRRALRDSQDYASLIDLENAESHEDLAEALRRFLRRNHKMAMPPDTQRSWFWPGDQHLEELMDLAEDNVALVRAAIESYALLWEPTSDKKSGDREG